MNSEANRLLLGAISAIAEAVELMHADAFPPPARPRRDHASTVRELERGARGPLPVLPVEPSPMPTAEPSPMAEPAQPAAEAAAPKTRRGRAWTPEQRQAATERMRATMAKRRGAAAPAPVQQQEAAPVPEAVQPPTAAPGQPETPIRQPESVAPPLPPVVDDPREDARNLLAAGMSPREVADETGLKLSEVSALAFALREQRAASAGRA